jgi:hypothetical protein
MEIIKKKKSKPGKNQSMYSELEVLRRTKSVETGTENSVKETHVVGEPAFRVECREGVSGAGKK